MKKIVEIIIVSILLFNLFLVIPNAPTFLAPVNAQRYDMDTDLGTVDVTFWGENSGDSAGGRVSNGGDVNGDGYDDILILARNNGASKGQVYLIFGRGAGLKVDMHLSQADASFTGEITGDLGICDIGIVEDVNNDGYDDILIGAGKNDEGAKDAGQVYLILGKSTGWSMDVNLSNSDASFLCKNENVNAGCSVASAGDVNGDSYNDIIIGGWGGKGYAYIIFGKASGWSMDTDIDTADASFLDEKENGGTGLSVSGNGDVNGDGFDDVLVGDYSNGDGGQWSGEAYAIFGKASGWLQNLSLSKADASFMGKQYDQYGYKVSIAGDLNNDGFDDILVGARQMGGPGDISVFFGKSSGWSLNTPRDNADASFVPETTSGLPSSISGAGDVNSDGFDDILVGCSNSYEGGTQAGQVYLFFGKASGWSMDFSYANANASFIGENAGDRAGASAAGGGDVNGDGFDDILIGATGNSEGGSNAGQVYMVFMELNYGPKTVYSLKAYSDPGFSQVMTRAEVEDTVYIEVIGEDEKPATADVAFVNVTSSVSSPDGFRLSLLETGVNTGVYRGSFKISCKTCAALSLINATIGENVTVNYFKDATKYATFGVDTPVQIRPLKDRTIATEDELYGMTYHAIGYNTVSAWTFNTNASWLTWNSATHNISGTPDNGDVGSYWVRINITDGLGNYDEHYFTVTVQNVQPTILTENVLKAFEDELYAVDYDSDDEGQGDAKWLLETNSSWLSLEPATGNLSGTPTNDERGPCWAKVTFDDGNGGTDWTNFTITVSDTNDPPRIITEDMLSATEDEFFTIDYDAVDIDGKTVFKWYLTTDFVNLSIDHDTGVLSGTPTNDDVGLHYMNVTVFDDRNGSDSHYFTLEVLNVNDHPFWQDVPYDVEMYEGEIFIFDVNASDIDKTDELIYDISPVPDTNISIDPATGMVRWRATIDGLDGPPYVLSVTVKTTDGKFPILTEFHITIIENPRPAAFLLYPDDEGLASLYRTEFQWEGYDPLADDLTYDVYLHQKLSFVEMLRDDARLLKNTELTGYVTDGLEMGETYYWTVIPNDGLNHGTCADGIFSFVVNTPPRIDPIADRVIAIKEVFILEPTGTDANLGDSEKFEFSLRSEPEGMLYDRTRGIITWTPDIGQEGKHRVEVVLSDGKDSTNTTFEIMVVPKAAREPESFFANPSNLSILIVIIVIVIIFSILIVIIRKRKKLPTVEGQTLLPGDKGSPQTSAIVGKPGMLSGPTITIDGQYPGAQQPEIQGFSTVSAQYRSTPVPVPVPTPAIPAPSAAQPAQLPPSPFETQTPVTTHAQTPAPVPAPVQVTLPHTRPVQTQVEVVQEDRTREEESDVVPDFGLAGGPKPVQKEAVVHDVEAQRIVDEPDLNDVIAELRAAGVIKPTDENTVVHQGDTGVWRPDAKSRVSESKDVLEQLERLTELRSKGALTEEEFERKKRELLN